MFRSLSLFSVMYIQKVCVAFMCVAVACPLMYVLCYCLCPFLCDLFNTCSVFVIHDMYCSVVVIVGGVVLVGLCFVVCSCCV